MDCTKLLKILEGDISLIDEVNVEDEALLDDEVTVLPHHIRSILKDYLSSTITSDELNKWAEFICCRSEYGPPGWEDDDIADYYEDMMYVIQKLSTPEIDGKITPELVRDYISELDKYEG